MRYGFFLSILITISSCHQQTNDSESLIDLSGSWQFSLDTADIGIQRKWYLTSFNDSVTLPGTTDNNLKGHLNTDTTKAHLSRVYKYEGPAWYRKKITIPESFKNQHIQLFLERTKPSKIWIDSILVGESILLQSPQQFDVSDYLHPGEHTLTIRIDNRLELTPYGNVHIYSDETQTNWNGIIGKLYLEARPKTYISNLQVYPDIDQKKARIKLEITNGLSLNDISIGLLMERTLDGKTKKLATKTIDTTVAQILNLEYNLSSETSLWDEYQQPIYHLTVMISNDSISDTETVPFGMRKFAAEGTQLSINGRTTFLRGKHDAAVFPLTGHTPMDVASWKNVYQIAKSYGINHYRFHSYCPPEAAFTAADQEGVYLQVELPFWGGLDSDTVAEMLRHEGYAMLKAYANHPSFVMLSHGNEIWSGHDRVEENLTALKAYDDRPLYTMGSNNNIGYTPPREVSDFFVASRTPYAHDTILTHTRLTHAFVDSRDGGILNTQMPSTLVNYRHPVSKIDLPIVTHEIGQYQVYPDYNEIEKYTGPLKARNLEVFRDRLKKAGMLDQDSMFQQASGAWSALCYKAEMEAAIRTEGLGGFQLLDLQDFPGQGTALVGILDAFMDSKGIISREKWLQSCNDVVLLLEFPKYVWTTDEEFQAKVKVANYSDQSLDMDLEWEMVHADGTTLASGSFSEGLYKNEGITAAGAIAVNLEKLTEAEKLTINMELAGTGYSNSYPVWVYPQPADIPDTAEIFVTEALNSRALKELASGGKVLLFPDPEVVKDHSLPGLFPPDFWNYGMFKGISEGAGKKVSPGTLGLLTNPDHPVFNSFPTDFHTNWQWFSIIKASNPLILDSTAADYRPLVQVIDNLERNHKLGLIFEFKVKSGKLLVCMAQLNKIKDRPEANQFYLSIVNYMNTESFSPGYETNEKELKRLFGGKY